jgi:hypothetical protein
MRAASRLFFAFPAGAERALQDMTHSRSHSRANSSAFVAAGGKGSVPALPMPAGDGHALPAWHVAWAGSVKTYLNRTGLPGSDARN